MAGLRYEGCDGVSLLGEESAGEKAVAAVAPATCQNHHAAWVRGEHYCGGVGNRVGGQLRELVWIVLLGKQALLGSADGVDGKGISHAAQSTRLLRLERSGR